MQHNIAQLFNKFAGREILNPQRLTCDVDLTVAEMEKVAGDHGLTLRLWFPGMMSTMDFRTNRVNAYAEKDADGKFRVCNKFNIG